MAQKTKIMPMGGMGIDDISALFPGASTGMVIIYRGAFGWIADYVATSDLSDVDLTSLAARSLLIWDVTSSKWVAGYISMDDITDVDLTGLAAGSMLMYNGVNFTILPSPTAAGQILVSTSLFSASWATMYAANWWAIADHTPLETNEIDVSAYTVMNEIATEDYDVIVT